MTDQKLTPREYVKIVTEFFRGCIDLDPCDREGSIVKAVRAIRLPEDGLAEPWRGRVYANPPWGYDSHGAGLELQRWLAHAVMSRHVYRAEVVALIPAHVEGRAWWRTWVLGSADAICRVERPLVRFVNKDGTVGRIALAFVYYGEHYERFCSHFMGLGRVEVLPFRR